MGFFDEFVKKQPPGTGDAPATRRVLATNAPRAWPRIPVPDDPAGDAAEVVRQLQAHVAECLAATGLRIVERDRVVRHGNQDVRIDLVVRGGDDLEQPIFVFPSLDLHREGTMFDFLRALLRESGLFSASPVYYAIHPIALPAAPTPASILASAHRFQERAREAGVAVTLGTRDVSKLLAALRAAAGAPIENGGGDVVTAGGAFVGEWLRRRVGGEWMLREDLAGTVLVVRDASGMLQYEVPVFAMFPDLVRVGYDGLERLLRTILDETARHAGPREATLGTLDVEPDRYKPLLLAWLLALRERPATGEAAGVFRTCATCGAESGSGHTFGETATGLAEALDRIVALVNEPPLRCDCGSEDYREALGGYRIAEPSGAWSILVLAFFTDTHTRISVERLHEGTEIVEQRQS